MDKVGKYHRCIVICALIFKDLRDRIVNEVLTQHHTRWTKPDMSKTQGGPN